MRFLEILVGFTLGCCGLLMSIGAVVAGVSACLRVLEGKPVSEPLIGPFVGMGLVGSLMLLGTWKLMRRPRSSGAPGRRGRWLALAAGGSTLTVLFAIAYPNFINFAKRSKASEPKLVLDAIRTAEEEAPATAEPRTESVFLFELDPLEESCVWRLYDLPGKRAREVHATKRCPSEVLWLPSDGRVVYLMDRAFYLEAWPPRGEAVEGPKMEVSERGWWAEAWISAQTRRPRLAGLYEVLTQQEEDDIVVYRSANHEVRVQRDGSGVRYYVEDGKTYPRDPGKGREVWLPRWGSLNIAVVFELSDDGRWKEIASAPTRCEAGDTPCLDVLKNYLDAPSDAISMRKNRETYARNPSPAPDDWQQREDLAAIFEPDGAAGYVAFDDRRGIVFPIVWGATPHAHAPAYYCEDACAKRTKLDTPERQLTISVRGAYALIAREYSNLEARVFSVGRAAPLLELRGTAVFLPASPLWSRPDPEIAMVGGASNGVGREEGAGNLLEQVEEARARLDTAQPETLIALHHLEQNLAKELTIEFRANPQVRAILAGSSKDLVAGTAPGSFGEYASAREDLLAGLAHRRVPPILRYYLENAEAFEVSTDLGDYLVFASLRRVQPVEATEVGKRFVFEQEKMHYMKLIEWGCLECIAADSCYEGPDLDGVVSLVVKFSAKYASEETAADFLEMGDQLRAKVDAYLANLDEREIAPGCRRAEVRQSLERLKRQLTTL